MVSRNHFSQREVCHKSQERKKKVIAVKEVRSKEVDGSSASIGLLVSILVRYPEICTVSYTPDAKMLGFSFMVSRRLEDDEVQGFRSRALDSISVYLDLASSRHSFRKNASISENSPCTSATGRFQFSVENANKVR
jgi:hypothetical protein